MVEILSGKDRIYTNINFVTCDLKYVFFVKLSEVLLYITILTPSVSPSVTKISEYHTVKSVQFYKRDTRTFEKSKANCATSPSKGLNVLFGHRALDFSMVLVSRLLGMGYGAVDMHNI